MAAQYNAMEDGFVLFSGNVKYLKSSSHNGRVKIVIVRVLSFILKLYYLLFDRNFMKLY